MADSSSERSQEQWREWNEPEGFAEDGISCGVADSNLEPAGRHGRGSHCTENEVNEQGTRDNNGLEDDGGDLRPGPTNGLWADADWLHCRDGKWRPVEPGTFPLASRTSNRVGKLRAYGNCINVEAAQAFIEATMTTDDLPPSAGEIAK
jgi:DNA (cytosine-5)-methyltransferase 1